MTTKILKEQICEAKNYPDPIEFSCANDRIPVERERVNRAILDSGASISHINVEDFRSLFLMVTKNYPYYCFNIHSDYVCTCPEGVKDTKNFPTIVFEFKHQTIHFTGEKYMRYYKTFYGYSDICYF